MIAQPQVDPDIWMALQESPYERCYAQPPIADRCSDSQRAGDLLLTAGKAACGGFEVAENLLAVAVEALPFVGQGQVPGAAGEQWPAQILLQSAHLLAHCRLPHVQLASNCRKRPALHNPYKDVHAVEQVHRRLDLVVE